MTNTQHKRSASGRESAMHRDSQFSMLQRDAFFAYIQKLKVSALFASLFFCVCFDSILSVDSFIYWFCPSVDD